MGKGSKMRKDNRFFLFKIAESSGLKLKRDELKIIQYLLFIFIFLLLIIDFMSIIFYVRTQARQGVVKNHNFTQVIIISTYNPLIPSYTINMYLHV